MFLVGVAGESAIPERASQGRRAQSPEAVTAPQSQDRVPSGTQPRELTWRWANGPFGQPAEALISIPRQSSAGQRFPILIALHGRGESKKGPSRAARGWMDDYRLAAALERIEKPPLRRSDFQGFVRAARLRAINRHLVDNPYEGLIIVCPYLPNVMKGERAFEQTAELAEFLVDTLLPRVRAETPARPSPIFTGIDGVSLGARAALLVGLTRPTDFGVVSGLQVAIDSSEIARITQMAVAARAVNPYLKLRILTSNRDYYRKVDAQLSRAWLQAGVTHSFVEVVGTHSYRFNRGPGAYELLLFHDRALRGQRTF